MWLEKMEYYQQKEDLISEMPCPPNGLIVIPLATSEFHTLKGCHSRRRSASDSVWEPRIGI